MYCFLPYMMIWRACSGSACSWPRDGPMNRQLESNRFYYFLPVSLLIYFFALLLFIWFFFSFSSPILFSREIDTLEQFWGFTSFHSVSECFFFSLDFFYISCAGYVALWWSVIKTISPCVFETLQFISITWRYRIHLFAIRMDILNAQIRCVQQFGSQSKDFYFYV